MTNNKISAITEMNDSCNEIQSMQTSVEIRNYSLRQSGDSLGLTTGWVSTFCFDQSMHTDAPLPDCRINTALVKSQSRHTDVNITWWRQHRMWKFR